MRKQPSLGKFDKTRNFLHGSPFAKFGNAVSSHPLDDEEFGSVYQAILDNQFDQAAQQKLRHITATWSGVGDPKNREMVVRCLQAATSVGLDDEELNLTAIEFITCTLAPESADFAKFLLLPINVKQDVRIQSGCMGFIIDELTLKAALPDHTVYKNTLVTIFTNLSQHQAAYLKRDVVTAQVCHAANTFNDAALVTNTLDLSTDGFSGSVKNHLLTLEKNLCLDIVRFINENHVDTFATTKAIEFIVAAAKKHNSPELIAHINLQSRASHEVCPFLAEQIGHPQALAALLQVSSNDFSLTDEPVKAFVKAILQQKDAALLSTVMKTISVDTADDAVKAEMSTILESWDQEELEKCTPGLCNALMPTTNKVHNLIIERKWAEIKPMLDAGFDINSLPAIYPDHLADQKAKQPGAHQCGALNAAVFQADVESVRELLALGASPCQTNDTHSPFDALLILANAKVGSFQGAKDPAEYITMLPLFKGKLTAALLIKAARVLKDNTLVEQLLDQDQSISLSSDEAYREFQPSPLPLKQVVAGHLDMNCAQSVLKALGEFDLQNPAAENTFTELLTRSDRWVIKNTDATSLERALKKLTLPSNINQLESKIDITEVSGHHLIELFREAISISEQAYQLIYAKCSKQRFSVVSPEVLICAIQARLDAAQFFATKVSQSALRDKSLDAMVRAFDCLPDVMFTPDGFQPEVAQLQSVFTRLVNWLATASQKSQSTHQYRYINPYLENEHHQGLRVLLLERVTAKQSYDPRSQLMLFALLTPWRNKHFQRLTLQSVYLNLRDNAADANSRRFFLFMLERLLSTPMILAQVQPEWQEIGEDGQAVDPAHKQIQGSLLVDALFNMAAAHQDQVLVNALLNVIDRGDAAHHPLASICTQAATTNVPMILSACINKVGLIQLLTAILQTRGIDHTRTINALYKTIATQFPFHAADLASFGEFCRTLRPDVTTHTAHLLNLLSKLDFQLQNGAEYLTLFGHIIGATQQNVRLIEKFLHDIKPVISVENEAVVDQLCALLARAEQPEALAKVIDYADWAKIKQSQVPKLTLAIAQPRLPAELKALLEQKRAAAEIVRPIFYGRVKPTVIQKAVATLVSPHVAERHNEALVNQIKAQIEKYEADKKAWPKSYASLWQQTNRTPIQKVHKFARDYAKASGHQYHHKTMMKQLYRFCQGGIGKKGNKPTQNELLVRLVDEIRKFNVGFELEPKKFNKEGSAYRRLFFMLKHLMVDAQLTFDPVYKHDFGK